MFIGRLQNRCGNTLFGNPFSPTSEIRDTCIRGYRNQNKFPKHKVWWLKEAAQIRQTFIYPYVQQTSN